MKPIEGVNLLDIVNDAKELRIAKLKDEALLLIKMLLGNIDGLNADIIELKKQIEEKEMRLVNKYNILKKLEKGDWTELRHEIGFKEDIDK